MVDTRRAGHDGQKVGAAVELAARAARAWRRDARDGDEVVARVRKQEVGRVRAGAAFARGAHLVRVRRVRVRVRVRV